MHSIIQLLFIDGRKFCTRIIFALFKKRQKIVSVWNFPGFSSPVCCTIFFNFVWKSSAHICIFAKTKHSWMTQRKRWSQDLSLLPLYSFSYCIHVWIILCIVNDDHFTLTINNNRKMHWHECLKFWKKSPTSESKVAILPWWHFMRENSNETLKRFANTVHY